ncbi:hypothetical protein AB838_05735 [Rhodobacteraceae bacterium (ex Bugula neritina AB1)]|nr:hypothetical protein AB838_05735 [Rhodobacteraceae bacterium (ex Bugula neritina AB1)]
MSFVRLLLLAIFTAVFSGAMAFAQESEEREGGIIGTGIAGTVTALGSIEVNGQQIRFDDTLPVDDSLPGMTAASLRPGHTVAVTVQPEGTGWRALHIRQIWPLAGPVESADNGRLTILGSEVEAGELAKDVEPGDWLAVSGLWQGNRVLASRLDVLPQDYRQARLSGSYLGPDRQGGHLVGGTRLYGWKPEQLQPGVVLRVVGAAVPGGIAASQVETGLFSAGAEVVLIEGYYSDPNPDGLYTVLGSGLSAFTSNPLMISTDDRVIRCGIQGQLGLPPDASVSSRAAAVQLECTAGN